MTEKNPFAKQKDSRVVKVHGLTYFTRKPNPVELDGPDVPHAETAKLNEEIKLDDLKNMGVLERGHEHDWFYTDEELARGLNKPTGQVAQQGIDSESGLEPGAEGTSPAAQYSDTSTSDEWGTHEYVFYMQENKPNVSDTVDLAKGDADAAQRVLEAEGIYTDGDPRAGVVSGLEAVIKAGQS